MNQQFPKYLASQTMRVLFPPFAGQKMKSKGLASALAFLAIGFSFVFFQATQTYSAPPANSHIPETVPSTSSVADEPGEDPHLFLEHSRTSTTDSFQIDIPNSSTTSAEEWRSEFKAGMRELREKTLDEQNPAEVFRHVVPNFRSIFVQLISNLEAGICRSPEGENSQFCFRFKTASTKIPLELFKLPFLKAAYLLREIQFEPEINLGVVRLTKIRGLYIGVLLSPDQVSNKLFRTSWTQILKVDSVTLDLRQNRVKVRVVHPKYGRFLAFERSFSFERN